MHHPVDTHDLELNIERAARVLRKADRVAVLTGAGVSAESGVPTFRGAGGLWEGHRVTDVATPEAFARDPALVWRFYNQRRAGLRKVRPNPGHFALATLERRLGSDRFTLVTQNIDGLHRTAGSRHVLELHGRLDRVRCSECDYLAERPDEELPDRPECPQCQKLLRPDIVWFGEMLPHRVLQEAYEEAESCDCFLIIGTSAVVYPAADLIVKAHAVGATLLEFNLEPTDASPFAHVHVHGLSGQTLPEVVQQMD